MTPALDVSPMDVSVLRRLQAEVSDLNIGEAQELTEQASALRQLLQVRRAAAEMVREALRLECLALRRIGQLNSRALDHPELVTTAREFAAMKEDELLALVDAGGFSTPIGLKRRLASERRRHRDQDIRQRAEAGQASDPVMGLSPLLADEDGISQIAAAELLGELISFGDPFTVGEAATRLLVVLGVEHYDDLQHLAARDLVREAIGSLNRSAIEEAQRGEPSIVTYQEADLGWVRVPATRASVGQALAMITARRDQLAHQARRLHQLEEWWASVEAIARERSPEGWLGLKLSEVADEARFLRAYRVAS